MIHFDVAYTWLYYFESSCLTPPTKLLAQDLNTCLRPLNRAATKTGIKRMLAAVKNVSFADECAECCIIAGRAAHIANDLCLAQECLEKAAQQYNEPTHQAGVALWLLGNVRTNFTNCEGVISALNAFQLSFECFERLAVGYQLAHDRRANWYRDRLLEMKVSLSKYLTVISHKYHASQPQAQPQHVMDVQQPITVRFTPGYIKTTSKVHNYANLYTALFQTFPVSETVPASGFGPSGYDTSADTYLNLNHALIDGRTYSFHGLNRSGNLINLTRYLTSSAKFNVIRIHGDSMNNANIDNGDYVLVVMCDDAGDGDIVVAGIENIDSLATIKRLRRQNGKLELWPDSKNTSHKPIPIHPDDTFRIIGLAVAVLKPVPSDE